MTVSQPDKDKLFKAGIVPVLTITDVSQAVPLAEALVSSGLNVVEITLRTDCALEAIREIVDADLGCFVGAGTIVRPQDVDDAAKAGSEFLVTPATPPSMIVPLKTFDGPVIPGVSTPGEAMALADHGFDFLKFFPAEPSGGAAMLKSLSAPLPHLSFMPTGGISVANASDYLKLPNVIAAGGSWLASSDDLNAKNWDSIRKKAQAATDLVRSIRPA
ncbi:MAG: keto-deoxy-phosphogluconate aldolase [Ponticaulis sp.]|nr:keto-deoxy-phosphogluconate aldolase [Ponticaulis sp.]